MKSVAVRSGVLSQAEAGGRSARKSDVLSFTRGIHEFPELITFQAGVGPIAIVREKSNGLAATYPVKTDSRRRHDISRDCALTTPTMLGGLLLQVSNRAIVVPTMNVDRSSLRIKVAEIVAVENKDADAGELASRFHLFGSTVFLNYLNQKKRETVHLFNGF